VTWFVVERELIALEDEPNLAPVIFAGRFAIGLVADHLPRAFETTEFCLNRIVLRAQAQRNRGQDCAKTVLYRVSPQRVFCASSRAFFLSRGTAIESTPGRRLPRCAGATG
jgi:hypothetical protein